MFSKLSWNRSPGDLGGGRLLTAEGGVHHVYARDLACGSRFFVSVERSMVTLVRRCGRGCRRPQTTATNDLVHKPSSSGPTLVEPSALAPVSSYATHGTSCFGPRSDGEHRFFKLACAFSENL